MRITFTLPAYYNVPIGGYHVHYEYANRLAQRGHRVTIAFPHDLSGGTDRFGWLKWALQTRRWNRPLIGSYPLDPRVRVRLLPNIGPALPDAEIVIATAWQTAEALSTVPRSKGRRVYISYDFEHWMTANPEKKRRISETFRADFAIVATSSVGAAMVRACGGEPVANIVCGIDHNAFGVDRPMQDRDRYTLGFPERSEPFKGVADALDAITLLRERYGQALRVTCFGRPSDIRMPDWIERLGKLSQQDLRAFYNRHAIFMVPSHFEGFGLPGAEALACGAALVTTDNGGCRDYAVDAETALVVPPRSPEAMADAVGRLFEDDRLRERLSQKGQQCVASFTWETASRRLIEVIEGLV